MYYSKEDTTFAVWSLSLSALFAEGVDQKNVAVGNTGTRINFVATASSSA